MSASHDPVADPLPPYWRAKVEAAFRLPVTPMSAEYRRIPALTDLERVTLDAIEAGATPQDLATARGVTRSAIYMLLGRARRKAAAK